MPGCDARCSAEFAGLDQGGAAWGRRPGCSTRGSGRLPMLSPGRWTSYVPMRTAVECPSSTRTATDGPGRCAHSHGSDVGSSAPGLGCVEQGAQYVGDVHYADQASVSHGRQVPKV